MQTRELTIVAQDPHVRVRGRILTARVVLPQEPLLPGPRGSRIHVVDYDSSTHTLYRPPAGLPEDGFAGASDEELLANPHFHAQNVYAISMRILKRFERALGRRVAWSFGGHQLKIAPHAFSGANACYSKENEALLFGYFPARRGKRTVFTCLSHDVVAHETAHALLDGIRSRYADPSIPDQAALHEGFADLIALLSVFSLEECAAVALGRRGRDGWRLRQSLLLSLAKQVGRELPGTRRRSLRRSIELVPSARYLSAQEFEPPHRRGEILVAAAMHAFLDVWERRLHSLAVRHQARAVEEGAQAASHLLTMAIRALDYTPPIDVSFGDYLSALLTADYEASPDDSRFHFRAALRTSFARFGVRPSSPARRPEAGVWEAPSAELHYGGAHFDSLARDPDEVFQFVWANRQELGLFGGAFLRVESVRPAVRVGADGFVVRETVAEYVKTLRLRADELHSLGAPIDRPAGMPGSQEIELRGGGTLIFDEFGKLKYHVRNPVLDAGRQTLRLEHLWRNGHFGTRP
ncbi:MAG: hypothetical protein SFV18_01890 [Bryobacteraceae bacterium]|nr:hypothetical protein [Bryobacteraceae bacterium]